MKKAQLRVTTQRVLTGLYLAAAISSLGVVVNAQNMPIGAPGMAAAQPNPNITMCLYPVERGADGQQYIVTKAGYKVTVPGLGIAPDAHEVAVYRDTQNNFWYVDKNGVTQAVSHDQLQWTMAQISHQQAMNNIEMQHSSLPGRTAPGMMPQSAMMPSGQMPTGQAQPIIINNQQPSGGGGNSALATGMVAGTSAMMGSMMGSAMTNNSYHGVPYGVPMYNSAGKYYYNGANGEAHEVPYHTDNPYMNQWSRQQAYQNNSQNRQNSYNNLNGNQQQMLKNESYEDMKSRQTAQTTSEANGGTKREGDQQLHEERFGGGRFRR